VLEPGVLDREPHVVLPVRAGAAGGVGEFGAHVRGRGQFGEVRGEVRGDAPRDAQHGRAERQFGRVGVQRQVLGELVVPRPHRHRAVVGRDRAALHGERRQRVVQERELQVRERQRRQRAGRAIGDRNGAVLHHERGHRAVRGAGLHRTQDVPLAAGGALDREHRRIEFHLLDDEPAAVQLLLVVVQHRAGHAEERPVGGVAAARQLDVGNGDPAEDAHAGRADVHVDVGELFGEGGDDLLAHALRADPRIGEQREGGEGRDPGEDQPADEPTASAHPCPFPGA